jgi:hypothetical protein
MFAPGQKIFVGRVPDLGDIYNISAEVVGRNQAMEVL